MARLLQRQCVAIVEGVAIEHLRMTFKAERSLRKDPNSLELAIYNLSKPTLARLQVRHALVELVAGYRGQMGRLFHGQARSILPEKQGADWVTKVMCGDGGAAYGYGRANQSFAPGAKVTDVVAGLAKSAKVGIGNAFAAFLQRGPSAGLDTLMNGFTASGDAQSDIDTIVRTAGFTWSIQDGELQILTGGRDKIGDPTKAEVLSADTGLVGSPKMGGSETNGGAALLNVKCLLRPQIRPGSVVQIESAAIHAGQFRAEKVSHEGDTAGGDWFTTLEARALS